MKFSLLEQNRLELAVCCLTVSLLVRTQRVADLSIWIRGKSFSQHRWRWRGNVEFKPFSFIGLTSHQEFEVDTHSSRILWIDGWCYFFFWWHCRRIKIHISFSILDDSMIIISLYSHGRWECVFEWRKIEIFSNIRAGKAPEAPKKAKSRNIKKYISIEMRRNTKKFLKISIRVFSLILQCWRDM